MLIDPAKLLGANAVIPHNRFGEFALTNATLRSSVKEWAGESAHSNQFDDSLRVRDASYKFKDGKLMGVVIQGYFSDGELLRITKNGKTVSWPCSRQALIDVLGEPLSVSESTQENRAP